MTSCSTSGFCRCLRPMAGQLTYLHEQLERLEASMADGADDLKVDVGGEDPEGGANVVAPALKKPKPLTVEEKAAALHYADFELLLGAKEKGAPLIDAFVDTPNSKKSGTATRIPIDSPLTWVKALAVYQDLAMQGASSPGPIMKTLFDYQGLIIQYAQSYQWKAVAAFDADWRKRVSNSIRSGSSASLTDPPTLVIGAHCTVSASLQLPVAGAASQSRTSSSSSSAQLCFKCRKPAHGGPCKAQQVCFRFNTGDGCPAANCKYEHKCTRCDAKSHSAPRCFEFARLKATSSNEA